MISLPPLPPPPPPPLPLSSSPQSASQSLLQIVTTHSSKINRETPNLKIERAIKPSTISFSHPRSQRTNPIIWCAAIVCLIFSLTLIFFGIATLVIFLSIKPQNPTFNIPIANLNAVYFDSPQYFNGDMTMLANISNTNQKIDVGFEYSYIELLFSDRVIASHAIQPFTQRRRETRLESVHFVSSLVYVPGDLAVQLEKQVQANKVSYQVRATFKVRANLGLFHMSYWLHASCQLEMTGPPTGVIVARRCITKR